jgi:ABC-2 type transport system permease protein
VKALAAQSRAELVLTLRRGESVLLTLIIPILLLVFFSSVDILPKPVGVQESVDFLAPGILALAIMSTAMVGLGIATGFERQYGVLKRLGSTPLGRPRLLGAKTNSIVAVEVLQVIILVAVAAAVGWNPVDTHVGAAVVAIVLGTVAFAGLGLLMAGTLRGEVVLAAANGLYIVFLLVGGMVVPLSKLPAGIRPLARALPAGALSDALHHSLGGGHVNGSAYWFVLLAWAVAAPVAAALTFKWE